MKGWTMPAKIFAVLFVLFIMGYFGSRNREPDIKSKPSVPSNNVVPESPKRPMKEPSKWIYQSSIDKMRGTLTRYANVDSINKLYFDFPYGGGSSATLMLRKSPEFGRDVILSIEKGQFLCYAYDGCTVAMKFDGNKVEKYTASEASGGRSDLLFLRPYERIVSKLRNSKRLTIEAEFYQEGRQQYEFYVSGLMWEDQNKPSKPISKGATKSMLEVEEPPVEFKDKSAIEEIQKEYEKGR